MGLSDLLTPLDRWVMLRILEALGDPPVRARLWSGEEIAASDATPIARVSIRDRRTLLRLVAGGQLALGDAYCDGRVEIEGELLELLKAVFRAPGESGARGSLGSGWRRRRDRPNTRRGARDNIHHHYDIGNDFYRLWLDQEMVYTCAYFPTPEASLEEAQLAKMEHVCRKVDLRPGDRVVEAGCGWGSLALYMAERGASVKAYNISHEQIQYARERAARRGLAGRVEFIEDDYREASGEFDVFMSVGMLEHVGREHYEELGRVIDRCLPPQGRGLIHSIGRALPQAMDPWIGTRIFPGAYIPALAEMLDVLRPGGFAALDVENLRLHYARTLEHWLERFEKASDRVGEMYDRRFVRMWRLYLSGSIASFYAGSLQLFQIAFARPSNADVPWTRGHLYSGSAPVGLQQL